MSLERRRTKIRKEIAIQEAEGVGKMNRTEQTGLLYICLEQLIIINYYLLIIYLYNNIK